MGIFETGDMVGLDVTYGAMMAVYQETGDPRFLSPAAAAAQGQSRALRAQEWQGMV